MVRKFIYSMLPLAASLLLLACGNNTKPAQASDKAKHKAVYSSNSKRNGKRGLPIPYVPSSIKSPDERAAYASEHFWDALEPTDHTRCLDTTFMKKSFANFIRILPHTPKDSRERAVGAFADIFSADSAVYNLAIFIARTYLDDPNSPMRNEELYITFLRRFARDAKLSDAMRERFSYRLEQAMKNRPGTRATDFRLVTRGGWTSTLLQELRDTTLVLFYDHDCGHCKETVERLASPRSRLRYPVIAVEVTEDREGWEGTKGYLPAGWTVAFATDPIDGEAYYFPALPSLYLLTGEGTVIVKDGTIP